MESKTKTNRDFSRTRSPALGAGYIYCICSGFEFWSSQGAVWVRGDWQSNHFGFSFMTLNWLEINGYMVCFWLNEAQNLIMIPLASNDFS